MSEGIAEDFAAPRLRAGIFLRIAAATPLRLWAGVGDFPLGGGSDLVEPTEQTYLGMGEMVGLPAVQALINGVAERVVFTVGGVTAETLALADEEAGDIRGARCNLGIRALGDDWQPIDDVTYWLWEGEADVVQGSRSADAAGNVVRTVSISVGTVQTNRKRPALEFWTDTQQRRRSPTDRFCDRVADLGVGKTKRWPN